MDGVVSFTEYITNANIYMGEIAQQVFDHLEGDYKNNIKVIADKVDVTTLEPGYYMRFLQLQKGFHLYGIEVKSPTDIWVHENIPKANFKDHADIVFFDQLQKLKKQKRVIFHQTPTIGGGLVLHTKLANHFAKHGWTRKSPVPSTNSDLVESDEDMESSSANPGTSHTGMWKTKLAVSKVDNKECRAAFKTLKAFVDDTNWNTKTFGGRKAPRGIENLRIILKIFEKKLKTIDDDDVEKNAFIDLTTKFKSIYNSRRVFSPLRSGEMKAFYDAIKGSRSLSEIVTKIEENPVLNKGANRPYHF